MSVVVWCLGRACQPIIRGELARSKSLFRSSCGLIAVSRPIRELFSQLGNEIRTEPHLSCANSFESYLWRISTSTRGRSQFISPTQLERGATEPRYERLPKATSWTADVHQVSQKVSGCDPMNKIRALIADDSSLMRKIVERSLRQAGIDLDKTGVCPSNGSGGKRQGIPIVMITTEGSEPHGCRRSRLYPEAVHSRPSERARAALAREDAVSTDTALAKRSQEVYCHGHSSILRSRS
jgi:hypothetical protein